jgi:HK97 gp10 family phage protein
MDAVVHEAADHIANRARDRVVVGATGELRDSIEAKREGVGEYSVGAGKFYAIFVEFGTVHVPARPFLVPAAEEARGEIQAIAAAALRKL